MWDNMVNKLNHDYKFKAILKNKIVEKPLVFSEENGFLYLNSGPLEIKYSKSSDLGLSKTMSKEADDLLYDEIKKAIYKNI